MCHCAVWSADEFVINFYCCKENQYTLFRIYYVMLITWRYNHNPTTFCISHLIAQVITVEYKCRLQKVPLTVMRHTYVMPGMCLYSGWVRPSTAWGPCMRLWGYNFPFRGSVLLYTCTVLLSSYRNKSKFCILTRTPEPGLLGCWGVRKQVSSVHLYSKKQWEIQNIK